MVLIIADKLLSPPYFRACEEEHVMHGKFECLFQPLTTCTEHNVMKVAHRFESTKTANDDVHHSWQEWVQLNSFITRPSSYITGLVTSVLPSILGQHSVPSGHGIGVHIRQGTRTGPDLVTKHKTVWSPDQLLRLLTAVSAMTTIKEFTVISDSPALTNNLATSGDVSSGKVDVVVTSKSVIHASTFNDCVRELGCEGAVNAQNVARSVLIDMVVASRNDRLIASVDSTFAWVLMGMMSAHRGILLAPNDIFDLDNPACRAQEIENSVNHGGCSFRHNQRKPFTHPTSKP
jgi:hypothetical protein